MFGLGFPQSFIRAHAPADAREPRCPSFRIVLPHRSPCWLGDAHGCSGSVLVG